MLALDAPRVWIETGACGIVAVDFLVLGVVDADIVSCFETEFELGESSRNGWTEDGRIRSLMRI